jgi:hypothetical protein
MDEQRPTGSNLGSQFEQYRQRVMESDAVKMVQEKIQAQGPDLVERVKALASEAMVRRISIQHEGRTLFEFPLALGVGGALIAPQLAALGAVAALVTNCTITVEREDESSGTAPTEPDSTASSPESGSPTAGSDS